MIPIPSTIIWQLALAVTMTDGAETIPRCQEGIYCGFERPEDIVGLPGSKWMVISQSGDTPLVLFNPENGERRKVTIDRNSEIQKEWGSCKGRPDAIAARGNSSVIANGRRLFAVINISGAPRIEIFEIAGEENPGLNWIGCVHVPAKYQLNDVALAPDGSIFASHMFDLPSDKDGFDVLRQKFVARHPTGYAVHWNRNIGWQKVNKTSLSFANGIAVSKDGKTLAVGGTYEQALILVNLADGRSIQIELNIQPDNITPIGEDGFITTGHTGVPITGIAACRAEPTSPCAFPFDVVAVNRMKSDPSEGIGYTVKTIHSDSGHLRPGASVAVPHDAGFLLGTSFGDRISFITPDENE